MRRSAGYLTILLSLAGAGIAAGDQADTDDEALAVKALKEASDKAGAEIAPVGDVFTGQLAQRGSNKIEIALEKSACYRVLAATGQGIDDLSLYMKVDGEEVASDRISGKKPMVEWCSPGSVRVEVVLSSYSGQGGYAVGVYMETESKVQSEMRVGGAESDFTANRIRQMHKQFGKGRAAVSPLFRGNLSAGGNRILEVKLKSGHCYTIIGAGSASVRNLNLALADRNGRELSKDATNNSFPVVETSPCITSAGDYRVKVEMAQGSGEFGVQVFSD